MTTETRIFPAARSASRPASRPAAGPETPAQRWTPARSAADQEAARRVAAMVRRRIEAERAGPAPAPPQR
ncbi:hypothetical protein LNKW23_45360 [Paralimibaculum aggregatum]|uniref:Uncharacterized protein n=1 Tax=Paralimibaculum aggregatum TaxID=3036245 RepID=A0ABQ6LTC5_9RHOB|nr:hypothetical protein [Limibaculum sp. NKW23]GMG85317.1 hypothetical protein LNKW23_45360 [Limibaculum sp. NKW23]